MNPQPSRVLGSDAGSHSDNPYSTSPSDRNGGHEISSLDDPEPPASERSALLGSSAPAAPVKVAPRFENTAIVRGYGTDTISDETARSGSVVTATRGRPRQRPWKLKLSFLVACVLLYVNFSFLILVSISTTSPFFAHNALPAHFGSTFLPIWLSLLSLLVNGLSLISFMAPHESPHFASVTSLLSALFSFVMLILLLSVNTLRRSENVLTLVILGIAIASLLHAALSALLVERYAPYLDPIGPVDSLPEPGFINSLKRFLSATVAFFSVSLPIVVLHSAITVCFGMLFLGVCVRAYDASFNMTGHRWKVDPWRRHPRGGGMGSGVSELNGRPYWVHLACRGVENDPIFAAARLNSTTLSDGTLQTAAPIPHVKRTILVETDRGVPGQVGAQWVTKMLEEGLFTSADTEVRVCYWDRPGYGFSENSPSSATAHVVSALSYALSLSGEFARLGIPQAPRPPGTLEFETSPLDPLVVPSPLARSGFILVSQSYGALISTYFAAAHPELVHSALYISPTPPALQFSPTSSHTGIIHGIKFFFTEGLQAWTVELSIRRIWSAIRGWGREARVLSTAKQGLKGTLARSWVQEEAERSSKSKSALAWEKARTRYPERPTIVLSSEGGKSKEWVEKQKDFVDNVIKEGLVDWDRKFAGNCADGAKGGEGVCRKSLMKLVRSD